MDNEPTLEEAYLEAIEECDATRTAYDKIDQAHTEAMEAYDEACVSRDKAFDVYMYAADRVASCAYKAAQGEE